MVLARECGCQFHHWLCSKALTPKKVIADLMALSTEGYDAKGCPTKQAVSHVVLCDEAHGMDLRTAEALYIPIEDGYIPVDPYGGSSWLPRICYIAATTNPNMLPKPFADRFPLKLRLDPYDASELAQMIEAKFKGVDSKVANQIARRSKGNARDALNYTESVLRHGLGFFDVLGIDEYGMNDLDREYCRALLNADKPMSLSTIAAIVQEDPATLRDIVEPYLISQGIVRITREGRELTGKAEGAGSRGMPQGYAG
jgi:Holliday junction DNA helicase RuvB